MGNSCRAPRAPVAEAWGGNAALQLLMGSGYQFRHAKIVGDNLVVVRLLAWQGTIMQPHVEFALDSAINRVSMGHWRLACEAVWRRWNRAADSVAVAAKRMAIDAFSEGSICAEWAVRRGPGWFDQLWIQ